MKIEKIELGLSKRQKIVIASILLTLGLLFTQVASVFFVRYRMVFGLSFLAAVLSLWALWEGLTKVRALILLLLPFLFTLGVASFYFLLPVRWLTRLPVLAIFALSFYFLLLSQNVFNVAATRTIPLYRAASTVNFLFSLITAFFLFNVVFALDLSFYWNFLAVGLLSFPLILQVLWSVEMEKISLPIVIYSGILSLLVGECALALSFLPIAPTIWSLSLSTTIYVLLGIVTEIFREKLSRRVVFEYLGIGVGVLLFTFVTTSIIG
jgi:hypothetical protein